MMLDWLRVADELDIIAREATTFLDAGQRASVTEIARRIRHEDCRALLLADEVGMGKTRIAVALIEAVRQADGRAAIVLPAGLGPQWQKELRELNPKDTTPLPLRSYDGFIAGFMRETDEEHGGRLESNHKQWLEDRRKQRELPKKPDPSNADPSKEVSWADEKILMISHSFAGMRFPTRGDGPAGGWRRELLPNVARRVEGRRRNFRRADFDPGEISYVYASRHAARAIARNILKHKIECDLSGDYKRLSAKDYKDKILPLIGYALGPFDLVVIDEAHKARGTDSGLSRILTKMIWERDKVFRLGLTATPVELDSAQWIDTLGRIIGDRTGLDGLRDKIDSYVDIVGRLQVEELDDPLTNDFITASRDFQAALQPYVLRRDKRDDPQLRAFQDKYGDYRKVCDLSLSPNARGYTRDWLRRFCAAEALSILPQDNPRLKRVRLSIAKGYGWGLTTDEKANGDPEEESIDGSAGFWLSAIKGDDFDIYTHPAIQAAVRRIESYTAKGEKVLVFGRFTKPMHALTELLDAREMLRRKRHDEHWPAKKLPENLHKAIAVALQYPQLSPPEGGIEAVNNWLASGYQKWSNKREAMLARVRREIDDLAKTDRDAALLAPLLHHSGEGDSSARTGALLEALDKRRDPEPDDCDTAQVLDAFKSLLGELVGEDDDHTALQARLDSYLDDYAGRKGNFARMMDGNTKPLTRRLLQAAFNRAGSWPKVIVAQSLVGREGLNLQEACRTVVLLHAEWNPGIVEQQIGRVDRKNSRWLHDLEVWERNRVGGEPPRIRIHPVIVAGSYDDHNWQVLKARWLQLRAQLHGEVLPGPSAARIVDEETAALRERIKAATPRFAAKPPST